ncbi:MAG: RdgB/HAM1 family non-canonical purine NTP pyrophosphatase [Saprospiraceae bacterium]
MHTLLFATGNPNKIREVNEMLSDSWNVRSILDMGIEEELPENQDTLEGNALEKARYIYEKTGLDCFSEDTGLEIDALGGAPGVYTARYGGDAKDPQANIRKVLRELQGTTNRKARFRTVIALILGGEEYLFEGIAPGEIRQEPSGSGGFGYDPVFKPEGYSITFAEMDPATKNQISHRGQAVRKLVAFLKDHVDNQ